MLRRHAWVMDAVELGLMSRMEIGRVEAPITEGRFGDAIAPDWINVLGRWETVLLSPIVSRMYCQEDIE